MKLSKKNVSMLFEKPVFKKSLKKKICATF